MEGKKLKRKIVAVQTVQSESLWCWQQKHTVDLWAAELQQNAAFRPAAATVLRLGLRKTCPVTTGWTGINSRELCPIRFHLRAGRTGWSSSGRSMCIAPGYYQSDVGFFFFSKDVKMWRDENTSVTSPQYDMYCNFWKQCSRRICSVKCCRCVLVRVRQCLNLFSRLVSRQVPNWTAGGPVGSVRQS